MSLFIMSASKIRSLYFTLNIPAEKYKAYYQGQVNAIQVQSLDGKSIRFPASAIRQFLTADGVYGEFEIRFDGNNKLVDVRRMA